MSRMSASMPRMTRWTPEHRVRVGRLIGSEIDRRGWSPRTAEVELGYSTKTIGRIRKGTAAPSTMREVAEKLELSPAEYVPPRDATEQTQLDRIEAMLVALLEHHGLSPTDALNAAADKKAGGEDDLGSMLGEPPPPDKPH